MERTGKSYLAYALACVALSGVAGCFATTSDSRYVRSRSAPPSYYDSRHGDSHRSRVERAPDAYPRSRDGYRHRESRGESGPARDYAPRARRLD